MADARTTNRTLAFAALNSLLRGRDWSEVTMADVAREAKMSRQTLYSAFGNRQGLAKAYALQLAETFASAVRTQIEAYPGDIATGLSEGIQAFLSQSGHDPLIIALLSGETKPDLLALISTEAEPLIARATQVLKPAFTSSWMHIEDNVARWTAEVIARVGISFVSSPPKDLSGIAEGLATIIAPGLEAASVIDQSAASS